MPLMLIPVSNSRRIRAALAVAALALFVLPVQARKKDPVFATSANDPVLRGRIAALSPSIDPEEAARVAETAYTTGRDLRKEWRVVWPPGVQNFLVHTGKRKGGLCFQFAERLLFRLVDQKWETVEFHWAESFERTPAEHNVIVVTAKGQPFNEGIILDNWRYGGKLVWGFVTEDPHYNWHENKLHFQKLVNRRATANPSPKPSASPSPPVSDTETSNEG